MVSLQELEQMIEQYRLSKSKMDDFKEIVDKLNGSIKASMEELKLEKLTTSAGTKVNLSTQVRTTMNEDRLIDKLKTLGHTDAIITIEKPNEKAIEDKIYNGELSAGDIEDCLIKKQIKVLKIK